MVHILQNLTHQLLRLEYSRPIPWLLMLWLLVSSDHQHQAIIWTNAGLLLIGPLGTNFIKLKTFLSKKMSLKMLSAKYQPFCHGINMLTVYNSKVICIRPMWLLQDYPPHNTLRAEGLAIWVCAKLSGVTELKCIMWFTLYGTVETLYNTINFCWSTHKRHSIARPKGRGMGCLLWVQRATYCVD